MYITTNTNQNIHDMNDDYIQSDLKLSKKSVSICSGCGNQINDQYILRVAPDLEWHAKCLRCAECGQFLDENCTCFVRNGKTYCKSDYVRLFSKKCFKCKDCFTKNDFVMRASNRIYHIDCFRCLMCNKQLAPGDEFALKDDGLLCKMDNEMYEKNIASMNHPNIQMLPHQLPTQQQTALLTNNNNINTNAQLLQTGTSCQNITNLPPSNVMKNAILKCADETPNDYEDSQNCISPNYQNQALMNNMGHHIQGSRHMSSLNPQTQPQLQNSHLNQRLGNNPNSNGNNNSNNVGLSSGSSSSSSGNHSHRKDKTTRVRTVLNEKQLHTLRTCYGANPRPDALMKEQLVEMTGLSPRVIRVWFQNKRCKDKKKTILIKQMQEQQKNRQTIGHGIPMVASSPVRNDMNNLGPGNQVEIQPSATAYQTSAMSWKTMNDYSLNGMNDINLTHGMTSPNGRQSMQHTNVAYDQMISFGSDEEDCFDNLSDQGNDDSVSSNGIDETRIQQL